MTLLVGVTIRRVRSRHYRRRGVCWFSVQSFGTLVHMGNILVASLPFMYPMMVSLWRNHTSNYFIFLGLALEQRSGRRGNLVWPISLLVTNFPLKTLTAKIDNPISTAPSVTDLIEQCVRLAEDRYLSCSDPWSFLTLYTPLMLLKVHIGIETNNSAKALCTNRFLELHSKHLVATQSTAWEQQTSNAASESNQMQVSISTHNIVKEKHNFYIFLEKKKTHILMQTPTEFQQMVTSGTSLPPTAAWLDSAYPDVSVPFQYPVFTSFVY